ncbi:MAG: holo-ACP synthase [Chloroflexi bacterium]|nr:holo-ACP synthase [Chloroflexota bacterium]
MLLIGVDLIEIPRIARVAERWGDRFLRRVYTAQELAYSRGNAPQLAARFAAKEAVMKALGTGRRGVSWRDVEVVREPGHPPHIRLWGRARERAERLGIKSVQVSISHSREHAIAFVVGETS